MIKKVFLSLFLVMFSFGGAVSVFAEEIIQETIVSEEVVISDSEQEAIVSEETENKDFGFSQEEQRRPHDDEEDEDEEMVTICHVNNGHNGYSIITVPASAVDGEGDNDHSSHGDIIPITDRNDDGDITVADCTFDGDSDEDPIDGDEGNESRVVTIIADMIVCDSENLLPNWGNGSFDITSTTAQDFILESGEGCRFKSGRLFQWGDDLVSFPGDTFLGEALGWFTTDPTDTNGRVEFTVNLDELESSNRIEMRQVLEEGDLAFTYTANGNNDDSISAEFYCHDDVLNYDNWDWINNPQADSTYYCVGFNVEEVVIEEPQFCPVGNLIENGSFENPTLDSGWGIFSSEETGWDIFWTGVYDNQPEGALLEIQSNFLITAQDGNQYVELDTDWGYENNEPAGVRIGQEIETIEGKEYTVSFYTHARPDTNESENSLDFSIRQGKETIETYPVVGTSTWVRHEYTFVAEGGYAYIQFEYTGVENSLGILLDNVSVTCGDSVIDDGEDDGEGDGDEDPMDGEEENPSEEDNQSTTTSGSYASRGSVLGAFSEGEVLGASDDATCPAFTQFHKRGDVGGDVKMIQQFLNDHMQAGLVVDGVYGKATEKAVHAFQQKYWKEIIAPWTPELSASTTGRWYKTTRAWANELLDCREASQVLEDTGREYTTAIFVKEEETTETNTVN